MFSLLSYAIDADKIRHTPYAMDITLADYAILRHEAMAMLYYAAAATPHA